MNESQTNTQHTITLGVSKSVLCFYAHIQDETSEKSVNFRHLFLHNILYFLFINTIRFHKKMRHFVTIIIC